MADLEFRIGNIELMSTHPILLNNSTGDPYASRNKFIVVAENNLYDIYVAERDGHDRVYAAYDLRITRQGNNCDIVGGGSVYLDTDKTLCVGSDSSQYGPVPRVVALKFAELLKPELINLGIKVNNIKATTTGVSKPYWHSVDFSCLDSLKQIRS